MSGIIMTQLKFWNSDVGIFNFSDNMCKIMFSRSLTVDLYESFALSSFSYSEDTLKYP